MVAIRHRCKHSMRQIGTAPNLRPFNSVACAIIHDLVMNPHVLRKLQAKLDGALGAKFGIDSDAPLEEAVVPFDLIDSLPYLESIINEGLCLHSVYSYWPAPARGEYGYHG